MKVHGLKTVVERALVLDTDPEVRNVLSVDDVDRLTIRDFDKVIGLIRNQHGPMHRDIGNAADRGGNAGEDNREVSFTVEFSKRLAKLRGSQGRISERIYRGLVNHGENVVFAHDEQFVAIKLDFSTSVRREDHAIALLDGQGDACARVRVE